MPDYRPDAPSVDLFTADEHCVLHDWSYVDFLRRGPDGRRVPPGEVE